MNNKFGEQRYLKQNNVTELPTQILFCSVVVILSVFVHQFNLYGNTRYIQPTIEHAFIYYDNDSRYFLTQIFCVEWCNWIVSA